MMKTQAAVLRKGGEPWEITELDLDEPKAGEVLVRYEAAGLPAAAICSDAFRVTADAMAGLRGAPGYRYATTPHPVAVLNPDQVKQHVAEVLGDVMNFLTEPE